MWALGCCLYILLCACHPFDPWGRKNDPQLAAAIAKGKFDKANSRWAALSADSKDIIEKLLDKDAKTRMTAAELRQHPWITSRGTHSQPLPPLPPFHPDKLEAFKRLRLLLTDGLDLVRVSEFSKGSVGSKC